MKFMENNAPISSSKSTILSFQTPPPKNCSESWTEPSLEVGLEEIAVAARWWSSEMRQQDLSQGEVAWFEQALKYGMLNRCMGHWYPSEPMRGSGHRSVINDFSTDPVILGAAKAVPIRDITSRLPRAVMWLNPGSVKVKLEGRPWAESLYSNSNSSGTSGSEDEDNEL
eukprot:CAMPEP_0181307374 /NCGR_PEP_ID=MMETSP1101-20121128/10843_1 /TAXON_ID=46948 /ORGANISM="Rhodomonas abbreviata, Strain Caron Lab Isolate" /LENGTH=168 /DNA_ID=CAMNT_0023413581 /DNA_START=125 /DNA_END=631 /DNA_ORIENTATION=+